MIVGTLVVAYQMDFFENRNLGFNKEAVISFGIPDQAKTEVLKQQLLSNPGVKELSLSSGVHRYYPAFLQRVRVIDCRGFCNCCTCCLLHYA
jgi:putative ABC transport system permease protein